jgi:hypothetical protein
MQHSEDERAPTQRERREVRLICTMVETTPLVDEYGNIKQRGGSLCCCAILQKLTLCVSPPTKRISPSSTPNHRSHSLSQTSCCAANEQIWKCICCDAEWMASHATAASRSQISFLQRDKIDP